MSSPCITVCIPVYNRSLALRATVDSVLNQTEADWELLLVDDGSTDDTPDVIQGYLDPRVRYIRQQNQGQASARNTGLNQAQGEYIAFLDHDDRWLPRKLELQRAVLERDTAAGLVYGGIRFIDETGVAHHRPALPQPQGWVFEHLLQEQNFIFTMSNPMMRTASVRTVGGFDSSAGLSDDWDLFLRLSQVTRFTMISEVVVDYNLGNAASQTRDVKKVFESERRLLAQYLAKNTGVSQTVCRRARASLRHRFAPAFREQGWYALGGRDRKLALECYLCAIRLNPGYLLEPAVIKDLARLILRTPSQA